jgi:hypothetical protein
MIRPLPQGNFHPRNGTIREDTFQVQPQPHERIHDQELKVTLKELHQLHIRWKLTSLLRQYMQFDKDFPPILSLLQRKQVLPIELIAQLIPQGQQQFEGHDTSL